MKHFSLAVLLIALSACSTLQENQSTSSKEQSLMDLTVPWPDDAMRMNSFQATPTETLGEKIHHLNSVLREAHPNLTNDPLRLSPSAAASVIPGWTNRYGDMPYTLVPVVRSDLQYPVRYLSEILRLNYEERDGAIWMDLENE